MPAVRDVGAIHRLRSRPPFVTVFAKNRVQPANSPQAKCSVSWVMAGANGWQEGVKKCWHSQPRRVKIGQSKKLRRLPLVAVPIFPHLPVSIFRSSTTFATGC